MTKILGLLVLVLSVQALANVPAHEGRNEAEYSPQYAVVLNGYDPVSYFAEGGGSPVKGDTALTFTYGTKMYYFSSEANLNTFKSNPLKYEPSYGSWCAYGMALGVKLTIDPAFYTIHGSRLHLFINKSVKKAFDKDVVGHENNADRFWFNFSGEEARK